METPPAGASPAPGHGSGSAAGAPSALGDGRYVLGELLGSGGMGLVFRATDTVLGREVAVKLLADNLALDAESRERFSREARAAARITHPHVVQVFDVGEEAGRPYFVMEFVAGASLADVVRDRGPLPAVEVEEVAVQALSGLARAHGAGLLHRDLKPANLLRSRTGVVKVTDFGVAQATELPGLTRTGMVLGTLPYLAPERLAGAPATVASDLYGLGATLLELLTGTPPEPSARPSGEGPPARPVLDTVPPRLTGLLRSCLAADPAERPASAEEALGILAGDVPVPGAPAAAAPATQVLPVEEHAPTVVAPAHGQAGPAHAGPAETVVAPAAPADPSDARREHPQPLRARGWTRWVVLGGLALVVVLALTQVAGPGGDAPAEEAPAEPAEEAPAEPAQPADGGVPAGDTPAETARNLAEWLRDQAR